MSIMPISYASMNYKKFSNKVFVPKQQSFGHLTFGPEILSDKVVADIYYPTGQICSYSIQETPNTTISVEYDEKSKKLKATERKFVGYDDYFNKKYEYNEITNQEKIKEYHNWAVYDAVHKGYTYKQARLDENSSLYD